MKKTLLLAAALSFLVNPARANDQMRDWTLASGQKQQAEIIAYDETQKIATLRLPDHSEVKFSSEELTAIDRAWILQWIEQDEEARDLLSKIGGTVTEHTIPGKVVVSYAVDHPPVETDPAQLPMLILFHPGGNGRRAIYKYIESAAAAGITLVSMDYFRNTGDDAAIEAEMLETFTTLLPQIEATVPHDKNRMFMGGTSGGAWRSYHYAAQVPRPWAGVLAVGGWLGGKKYYGLPYPRLRVAMVNGDKDAAANQFVEPDSARLKEAGSIVTVHAFEGGHQPAPPSVQEKALRWLLADEIQAEATP